MFGRSGKKAGGEPPAPVPAGKPDVTAGFRAASRTEIRTSRSPSGAGPRRMKSAVC